MNVKLVYVHPFDGGLVYVPNINPDANKSLEWIHDMVEANPDMIFFFVTETTDIWDTELKD